MYLKKCQKCGTDRFEFSDRCFHCGFEFSSAKSKNKNIAGILCLLFGYFGAHEFYLGERHKGIKYIVLTVMICALFSVGAGLWKIDGKTTLTLPILGTAIFLGIIMCVKVILKSINFFTMSKAKFDIKYNL